MTELIKSRYLIETTGIRVKDEPNGQKSIDMGDLHLRVKDSYTKMPIGAVIAEDGKEYCANFFFASNSDECVLTPPSGGWGPRFDLAASAIWKEYSTSLPWHERTRRWAWRWMGVGWFLFGTLWGALMGVIGRLLIGSDCSATQ